MELGKGRIFLWSWGGKRGRIKEVKREVEEKVSGGGEGR